ncbi:MAG: FtsK/SpoIIIE domain-containing protein [Bacteroides sp.]
MQKEVVVLDILAGLKSLVQKAKTELREEHTHLLKNLRELEVELYASTTTTAAYTPLTSLKSKNYLYLPTSLVAMPSGFYYGMEELSVEDSGVRVIEIPQVHFFSKLVSATCFAEGELDNFGLINFALRAILSYPLGMSHVYMLDPNISGRFNDFSPICTSLEEHDNPKNFFHYLSTPKEQLKVLDILEETVNRNITTYLSDHSDLEEYNEAHPKKPVPYNFVFINDISRIYSNTELARLARLIYKDNATKAGCYIFFTFRRSELAKGNPYSGCKELAELIAESFELTYGICGSDDRQCRFESEATPSLVAEVNRLVQSSTIDSFVVDFKQMIERALSHNALWTHLPQHYDYTYISMPIGLDDANQLKELRFPSDAKPHSPHMFIGGKTGTGKTILLHNIILNGALRFSPQLLRFYLVDMKSGVSFLPYKNLPHAEVVCASSDRLYACTVLERALQEDDRRGRLFKQLGVTNIESANTQLAQKNEELLPMIMVIIDEFQDLVRGTDALSRQASDAIERIHKKGRSQGIFIGLCTQSLGGVQTNISQVGVKLSLTTSSRDSIALLGNDGAVALRGKGRAILNTSVGGEREYNEEFQVAYINETEDLPRYINQIKQIYEKQGGKPLPSLLFNENDHTASLASNPQLVAKTASQNKVRVYLGIPMFCREAHSAFNFHRDSQNNLVIVGNDRVTAMHLIGSVALQFVEGFVESEVVLNDLQTSSSSTYNTLHRLAEHPHIRFAAEQEFETTLDFVYNELQNRKSTAEGAVNALEILYILSDLRPNEALRARTSAFSFSATAEKTLSAQEKLLTILEQGSELGIHVLLYAYSMNNLLGVNDQFITKSAEIKIGLRGGDSAKLIMGFGVGEAVGEMGQARLIAPKDMGLSYAEGDLFIPYNAVGDNAQLPDRELWEAVFSIQEEAMV